MMNRKTKTAWVRALRSGKYRQGAGALRNRDSEFCCLGVLCHISPLVKIKQHAGDFDVTYTDGASVSSSKIPSWYRERLGITRDEQDALVSLNDEDKAPFDEIADWIEVNL